MIDTRPCATSRQGLLVALALVWLALAPWLHGAAAAQEPVHSAGLVIDYGDGRVSYAWVPFTEESISGIELLERSGLSLVAVSFGGLGKGVCEIEGTGCGIEPCRARLCQTADPASPFWQYLRQDGPGNWKRFALGASQSDVRDGDIDGWAWAGAVPELPALALDEIAERVDAGPLPAERPPRALAVTIGDVPPAAEESGSRELARGAAIIAGVVGAGMVAIWRARRTRSHPG
ncbi:MAG: hypothetical protein AVDCRST_MAG87-228 [uncultured Thermomicrobiales bacterium]|uniref:Uncharacterized protein n=1 Tax=uncultured Thermomicrobiales bacterium TaxID=1645740 RepID=A0A6J4UA29_9BACT|nr:MAG: hypothetical protein AVDCRST_MAG87-228 [uncultured Thermomicrobiales bacterium]